MPMRDELIVTESLTPVVRAGAMNASFVILAIMTILFAQMPVGAPAKYSVIAVAVGIVTALYVTTVTRLSISEAGLRIVCPLHQIEIPYSALERVTITTLSLYMTMWLRISEKGKRLPRYFRIAAIATNWGDFRQTEQRLKQVLGDYLKKT